MTRTPIWRSPGPCGMCPHAETGLDLAHPVAQRPHAELVEAGTGPRQQLDGAVEVGAAGEDRTGAVEVDPSQLAPRVGVHRDRVGSFEQVLGRVEIAW